MDIRVVCALIYAQRLQNPDLKAVRFEVIQQFYKGKYSLREVAYFYAANRNPSLDTIKLARSVNLVVLQRGSVSLLFDWLGFPASSLDYKNSLTPLKDVQDSILRLVGTKNIEAYSMLYSAADEKERDRLRRLCPAVLKHHSTEYDDTDMYVVQLNIPILRGGSQEDEVLDLDCKTVYSFANAYLYYQQPIDYDNIAYYFNFYFSTQQIRTFYQTKCDREMSDEYLIRRFRRLMCTAGTISYFVDWYGFPPSIGEKDNLVSLDSIGVILSVFSQPYVQAKLDKIVAHSNKKTMGILYKAGVLKATKTYQKMSGSFSVELLEQTDFTVYEIEVRQDGAVMCKIQRNSTKKCSWFSLDALDDAAVRILINEYGYELSCVVSYARVRIQKKMQDQFNFAFQSYTKQRPFKSFQVMAYIDFQDNFDALTGPPQRDAPPGKKEYLQAEPIAKPRLEHAYVENSRNSQKESKDEYKYVRVALMKDDDACFRLLMEKL